MGERLTPGQLATLPLATEATEATVGTVLDMGATEATAMVGMVVATAPWALPAAMLEQAAMWPPTQGQSTMQRGPRSLRLSPNMQLATLGWVGMGLGLEAILPLDTLCLLTLPWATLATQEAMGFTTATEATVASTEAPTTAK